jgi:hypothetical protein
MQRRDAALPLAEPDPVLIVVDLLKSVARGH